MKKNITTTIILILSVQLGFSQFKVINNGNVGIGTNSPTRKLQVEGDALINNGNFFVNNGGNQIRMIPSSGGDAEMGSSTHFLTFWHPTGAYNILHAQAFHTVSDNRLKQNINPITNSMAIIKQLNGVSFQYRVLDTLGNPTDVGADTSYGFLAQDVQKVLPLVVSNISKGYLSVNYSAIIPFLVEGLKMQQKAIDSLHKKASELDSIKTILTQLTNAINSCCSNSNARTIQSSGANNVASTTTIATQDIKLTNFDAVILNKTFLTHLQNKLL